MEIIKIIIGSILVVVSVLVFVITPFSTDFTRISVEQINTYLISLIFLVVG